MLNRLSGCLWICELLMSTEIAGPGEQAFGMQVLRGGNRQSVPDLLAEPGWMVYLSTMFERIRCRSQTSGVAQSALLPVCAWH